MSYASPNNICIMYEVYAIWIICKNISFISAYEQDLSVKY